MDKNGAVFVLTGVSRGLGEGLLRELLACGHDVIGIGRSAPRSIGDDGGKFMMVNADLQGPSDEVFQTVVEGAVDYRLCTLILNAAVVEPVGLAVSDCDELRSAFEVNLFSSIQLADVLLRRSSSFSELRIVNISSGAALRPLPGWGAYCASKAACRMWLDCIGEGYPDVEIRHIDPGVMNTGMQAVIRSYSAEDFPLVDGFREMEQTGKLRSPAEVAKEIVQTLESSEE